MEMRRRSTRAFPEGMTFVVRRSTRPKRNGRRSPSPNPPFIDPACPQSVSPEVYLRHRRRRTYIQRNQETGYSSHRRLTPKRIALIKKYINQTAKDEDYGSEQWMDKLITILDPNDLFDLLYEDIKLWLQVEPAFALAKSKSVKNSNPKTSWRASSPTSIASSTSFEVVTTGTRTGNDQSDNVSNVTVSEVSAVIAGESASTSSSDGTRSSEDMMELLEEAMDLSLANLRVATTTSGPAPSTSKSKSKVVRASASSSTQIPNGSGGAAQEEEEDIQVVDPPPRRNLAQVKRELCSNESSPRTRKTQDAVSSQEAAIMRRTFYQKMKKKLDDLVEMNANIPPDDPNHINEEMLKPVVFMVDSLAKPNTPLEEMRGLLFHASTFVLNQVISSGPVLFAAPDKNNQNQNQNSDAPPAADN